MPVTPNAHADRLKPRQFQRRFRAATNTLVTTPVVKVVGRDDFKMSVRYSLGTQNGRLTDEYVGRVHDTFGNAIQKTLRKMGWSICELIFEDPVKFPIRVTMHDELSWQASGFENHLLGFYRHPGQVEVRFYQNHLEELCRVLAHELIHALVDKCFIRPSGFFMVQHLVDGLMARRRKQWARAGLKFVDFDFFQRYVNRPQGVSHPHAAQRKQRINKKIAARFVSQYAAIMFMDETPAYYKGPQPRIIRSNRRLAQYRQTLRRFLFRDSPQSANEYLTDCWAYFIVNPEALRQADPLMWAFVGILHRIVPFLSHNHWRIAYGLFDTLCNNLSMIETAEGKPKLSRISALDLKSFLPKL